MPTTRQHHGEDASSVRILVEPLRGPALVADYLAGRGEATRFFAHPEPFAADGYHAQLRRLGTRFDRPARERVARALTPVSELARERLERFVRDGGGVVTTGQQAGLFSGPLYTIHKILSAIRLARALEAELGRLVLPVFWCASEDHDWDEINHTYVAGPRTPLRRIALHHPDPRPLPASERVLGAGIETALADLRHAMSRQAFTRATLDLVEAAYRPEATVAQAFRELIAGLFGGTELLVTDAADAAVKAGSREVLAAAASGAGEHERLLRERGAQLTAAGYHQQVSVLSGAANLFVRTEAGRERLYRDGGGWVAHRSRARLSDGELEALLAREPERLSPNALLRPVAESAVFPVLAYVAGPGEIAYLAQTQPLFEAAGVPMPVIHPRASVRLVPQRLERDLARLGVTLEELATPRDTLRARLVRGWLPDEGVQALERVRRDLVDGFGALIEAASGIDPTLRGAVARQRNAALLAVARAERTMLARQRDRSAVRLARLQRVMDVLRPLDTPQERVLNVSSFLPQEPALIERGLAALPAPLGARA